MKSQNLEAFKYTNTNISQQTIVKILPVNYDTQKSFIIIHS